MIADKAIEHYTSLKVCINYLDFKMVPSSRQDPTATDMFACFEWGYRRLMGRVGRMSWRFRMASWEAMFSTPSKELQKASVIMSEVLFPKP